MPLTSSPLNVSKPIPRMCEDVKLCGSGRGGESKLHVSRPLNPKASLGGPGAPLWAPGPLEERRQGRRARTTGTTWERHGLACWLWRRTRTRSWGAGSLGGWERPGKALPPHLQKRHALTSAQQDPLQTSGTLLRGLPPPSTSPPSSSSHGTREDARISTNSPQSLRNFFRCQTTCWNLGNFQFRGSQRWPQMPTILQGQRGRKRTGVGTRAEDGRGGRGRARGHCHPHRQSESCSSACVIRAGRLCEPRDGSPPGSSVHGILQARTLEWIAISFSRGIFPTQGSNPGLLHCRQTLYPLSHQGSLIYYRCSSNLKCYIMTIGPTNQATQWWE